MRSRTNEEWFLVYLCWSTLLNYTKAVERIHEVSDTLYERCSECHVTLKKIWKKLVTFWKFNKLYRRMLLGKRLVCSSWSFWRSSSLSERLREINRDWGHGSYCAWMTFLASIQLPAFVKFIGAFYIQDQSDSV